VTILVVNFTAIIIDISSHHHLLSAVQSVEMQLSQHQHQDSPLSSPGNVSLTLQRRNMDTSVGRCEDTAALQLMVNSHEGKKPSTTWTRPSGRPRRTWLNHIQDADRCRQYGDLRLLEVTEERNSPSGLRDDDDDDDVHIAAVHNRNNKLINWDLRLILWL